MNETKLLPDKRSELLRLAIADLQSVAKDSRYKVVMANWHSPSQSTATCEICLAGAVMVKTLGADISSFADPESFDWDTAAKLYWLDLMRRNNPYKHDDNPTEFVAWLEEYANGLEAEEKQLEQQR